MLQLLTFIKNFKEVSLALAEKMRKSTGNIVNIAAGESESVPGVGSEWLINREGASPLTQKGWAGPRPGGHEKVLAGSPPGRGRRSGGSRG